MYFGQIEPVGIFFRISTGFWRKKKKFRLQVQQTQKGLILGKTLKNVDFGPPMGLNHESENPRIDTFSNLGGECVLH